MTTHRTLADYWASTPHYPLGYAPTTPGDPIAAPTEERTILPAEETE